jgi:hypothetical protein
MSFKGNLKTWEEPGIVLSNLAYFSKSPIKSWKNHTPTF